MISKMFASFTGPVVATNDAGKMIKVLAGAGNSSNTSTAISKAACETANALLIKSGAFQDRGVVDTTGVTGNITMKAFKTLGRYVSHYKREILLCALAAASGSALVYAIGELHQTWLLLPIMLFVFFGANSKT
jgi:hypothetical protein